MSVDNINLCMAINSATQLSTQMPSKEACRQAIDIYLPEHLSDEGLFEYIFDIIDSHA